MIPPPVDASARYEKPLPGVNPFADLVRLTGRAQGENRKSGRTYPSRSSRKPGPSGIHFLGRSLDSMQALFDPVKRRGFPPLQSEQPVHSARVMAFAEVRRGKQQNQ
jgi:hypothetical protein